MFYRSKEKTKKASYFGLWVKSQIKNQTVREHQQLVGMSTSCGRQDLFIFKKSVKRVFDKSEKVSCIRAIKRRGGSLCN